MLTAVFGIEPQIELLIVYYETEVHVLGDAEEVKNIFDQRLTTPSPTRYVPGASYVFSYAQGYSNV